MARASAPERAPLAARGVEVFGREPALEGGLARKPFLVGDREPGGVSVAALVDGRLTEEAFVLEAEPLGRGSRRRVQGIALPLVAAIAELVEDAAHEEIH